MAQQIENLKHTVAELLANIQMLLEKQSNEKARAASKKFIPTSERIYGVRVPEINKLAQLFKSGGFELLEALWLSGAFEERLLAAKLLGKIGKQNPDKTLYLARFFSVDIVDWAVCDTLATQGLRSIHKIKQKEIFALARELIQSTNLWQRRFALVMLEPYTADKKLHHDIYALIDIVKNDKEYYIKKAIQWLQRNMNEHQVHKRNTKT